MPIITYKLVYAISSYDVFFYIYKRVTIQLYYAGVIFVYFKSSMNIYPLWQHTVYASGVYNMQHGFCYKTPKQRSESIDI
jgi:hypothetical protein